MKKLFQILKDPRIVELIRYGAAGVATTLVNFLFFGLFYNLLCWNESIASAISVILSIVFAYFVNKAFVFRSHCPNKKALLQEAISFFSARGLTLLLEVGGMFLFGTILSMNAWVVKIALNILVLVLNYIFSKVLIFRNRIS